MSVKINFKSRRTIFYSEHLWSLPYSLVLKPSKVRTRTRAGLLALPLSLEIALLTCLDAFHKPPPQVPLSLHASSHV